ncbi:hypothetical protein ACA910_002963 [Epithemia clementina (nom. ined.)]
MADEDYDDLGDNESGEKGRTKSRRELPAGAVATLKAWLLSPEHFTHPYPTPQDQAMLMQKTGIDKKQLKNWFTNARRRIWKPMLKKQIEQGKLTTTGAGVPGLMIPTIPGVTGPVVGGPMDNPHSVQAMRLHYQQAMEQQAVTQQMQAVASLDSLAAPAPLPTAAPIGQLHDTAAATKPSQAKMAASGSIGTFPQMSSNGQLSKTDSHAVLMELFARDQDLVKQATESARLKAESKQQMMAQQATAPASGPQNQQASAASSSQQQHPMKNPSQNVLTNVPTLNSWPHFSSITSLNNLGTMPGVKSITSLSGADLASKGTVNKMGNLAQVKSVESMGKNDSYAFLEVFFGEKSSTCLSGMETGKDTSNKGVRLSGDNEDNEIGLSLEDESPSAQAPRKDTACSLPSAVIPTDVSSSHEDTIDSGTLKRAYDDALAARGLISVSRSSEKLTELPAKIRRTLSQNFISKQQAQLQQHMRDSNGQSFPGIQTPSPDNQVSSSQRPGEESVEPSSAGEESGHVNVPFTTMCALCHQTNVDTQLRPCGHMYHERCLKPNLQTPTGPPVCPVDNIPIQSALLAVPTQEATSQKSGIMQPPQSQPHWSTPHSTDADENQSESS